MNHRFPYIIFTILWLLVTIPVFGQRISPTLHNAAGGTQIQSGFQLDWSLGEFMIDNYRSAGFELSLGFLQDFGTSVVTNTLPDLTVDSIIPEATLHFPGDEFSSVVFTVRNQGNADVEVLFSSHVYLSSDTIFDVGEDVNLGLSTINGLAVDSSVILRTTISKIPENTIPGDYYFLVKVDDSEQIQESNEMNNLGFVKIKILDPAESAPDLVIDTILFERNVLFIGDKFVDLKYVVANKGFSDAPRSNSQIYLSTDSLLDKDSDLSIGFDFVDSLAPEERDTAFAFIDIPTDIEPGDWYMIISLDYRDQITEINELNNCRYLVFEIADESRKPDLVVDTLILPASNYFAGDGVELLTSVTNQGGLRTSTDFGRVYLSDDAVLDPDQDESVGFIFTPELDPSESTLVISPIHFDETLKEGSYYLIAALDVFNTIDEFIETNNIGMAQIQVLDNSMLPDLTLESASLIGEASIKDSIFISVGIVNQGQFDARPSRVNGYLTKDDTLNLQNVSYLGFTKIAGLDVGERMVFEYMGYIRNNVEAGDWNVILLADGFSWITESNEENNEILLQNITVQDSMSTTTAISNTTLEEVVILRPNPARDYIALKNHFEDDMQYYIITSLGILVAEGLYQPNSRIALSRFSPGLYWLILIDREGRRGVYPFIKS